MKTLRLLSIMIAVFALATHTKATVLNDSISKKGCIVHFQIDCKNPGIKNDELLTPLIPELKRVFKLDSVVIIEKQTVTTNNDVFNTLLPQIKRVFKVDSIAISGGQKSIFWTDGVFRLSEEKELTQDEVAKALVIKANPIISIKVEHWVGSLLLVKGKKHVLSFTCTLFDRNGKRVWSVQKKDSCCRSIEFSSGDFNDWAFPIDKDSFLLLYRSVIGKAFGGF